MQFLYSGDMIHRNLLRIMKSYRRIDAAVAWATTDFPVWSFMKRNQCKLRRVIIGTHFTQTHPDVLRILNGRSGVRFNIDHSGVFHHKFFLCSNGSSDWEAIIGSANLTKSAFFSNGESAMLIDSRDENSDIIFGEIENLLKECWDHAEQRLGSAFLENYKLSWMDRQSLLQTVSRGGELSNRSDINRSERKARKRELARPASSYGPLLRLTWKQYVGRLKSDNSQNITHWMRVMQAVQKLLNGQKHFCDLEVDERRRVAGTTSRKENAAGSVNWATFGYMGGSGYFMQSIIHRSKAVSFALDAIPRRGDISRPHYELFVKRFARIPGSGIATGTRLLAMWRPDVFVSVNSASGKAIRRDLSGKCAIRLENYWDTVVTHLMATSWWKNIKPSNSLERRMWKFRAALLDVFLYQK